jgi:hypothetical protein
MPSFSRKGNLMAEADTTSFDDVFFCARCSSELQPGSGTFYRVAIEAIADPSGPSVDEEETAEELRGDIERLLKQLDELSEREALDQVYRRLTLHLCLACYRQWIEDPTG